MPQYQQSVDELASKMYDAFVKKWAVEVVKADSTVADVLEEAIPWKDLPDYEQLAWVAAAVISVTEQRRNRSPVILPSEVLLTFDTPGEKQRFMGQLSDGWGENEVTLASQPMWDPKLNPFDEIHRFHVTRLSDDDDTQID